jgi:hypothetical protein
MCRNPRCAWARMHSAAGLRFGWDRERVAV